MSQIRYALWQGEGGGVFSFFDYSSPFCFLLIEFHHAFSISYKILLYYVYYYCILIEWYAVGTLFFPGRFTFSILTPLFLPFSFVFFILFHSCCSHMRDCLGKYSCMSSTFPIAILDDTCNFFDSATTVVHNGNPVRYGRNTDAVVNLNTKLNYALWKLNASVERCIQQMQMFCWKMHQQIMHLLKVKIIHNS